MARQAATYDCDVAIVGAGIAGALIGWRLATAGAKVIMLEAGSTVDRSTGPALAFSSLATTIPEAAYETLPWAPIPSTLDPNNYLVQTGPIRSSATTSGRSAAPPGIGSAPRSAWFPMTSA
jgi:choline dehydrogenase-like flavoprotein